MPHISIGDTLSVQVFGEVEKFKAEAVDVANSENLNGELSQEFKHVIGKETEIKVTRQGKDDEEEEKSDVA